MGNPATGALTDENCYHAPHSGVSESAPSSLGLHCHRRREGTGEARRRGEAVAKGPAEPTARSGRAAALISPAPPRGRGPRTGRRSRCQAPPPAPPPPPGGPAALQAAGRPAASGSAPAGGRAGSRVRGAGRRGRRGRAGRGAVTYLPRSRAREREAAGAGGAGGAAGAWGNFPPSTPPARTPAAAPRRVSPGARLAHQTRTRTHPARRRPCPPFPRRPPASSGVISRAQGGRAGGGRPRVPLSWGSAWGQAPGRSPRARRPHPAALSSLADTRPARWSHAARGAVSSPRGPGLPRPVRRKDSLRFCASALFLWRGRSSDSRRARASAPCISPMASGGRRALAFP